MGRIENRRRTNSILLITSCILSFAFFGLGAGLRYGPDLYIDITDQQAVLNHMIKESIRVLSWLLTYGLFSLKLSYPVLFYIGFIEEWFFITIAVYRLADLLLEEFSKVLLNVGYKELTLASVVISFATVANIFSAEAFLYPIGLYYMVSVWLCIEATHCFVKILNLSNTEEHSSKHFYLIKLLVSLIVSASIYQTNIAVYIVLAMTFILARSDKFLVFVKRSLQIGIHYLIAMAPQILLVIVSNTSRIKSKESVNTITKAATKYAPKEVEANAYIFQRIPIGMWVFLATCFVIGLVLFIIVIRRKEYIETVKGLVLAFVVIIMGFLPYIMKVGGDYKPRVYYPLATLVGVLYIYAFLKGYILLQKDVITLFFAVVLSIMLVTQWFSFLDIFTAQYITDYEDKYISEMIGECIDEYEIENGMIVDKVVFYEDSEKTKYINNTGWCLSQRGYSADWSRLSVLNYWLNKKYVTGQEVEEFSENFSKMNWNSFSREQVRFLGDTVHICVY